MRILKIIHGYPPAFNAGSEVYSKSICEQLALTQEVMLFTRELNQYAPDFAVRQATLRQGIAGYFINMPRERDGFRQPQADEALERIIQEVRPHIAHIGHLNHLSTGLVEVLHTHGIPIIFTLHDFWLMCPRGQFLQRNFGQGQYHQLCQGQENTKCATQCYNAYFTGRQSHKANDLHYWEQWVAERMAETRELSEMVDHFIAPSRYLQQRFVQEFGLPAEKVTYLDYGFPLHYLSPVNRKPHKNYRIAYIGTHIPAKGVNHLIEAFAHLQGQAELHIWGREHAESTPALRQMAQACALPVHFRGEYNNPDIACHVFAEADCIVVPSIWGENSPLVIHEAQACHVPVITANHGGMAEYVQHQVNGLLFEHRSAGSLATQLQWAHDHPAEMRAMGQKGYLYNPNGAVPDIESHVAELLNLYQQTIENHGQYQRSAANTLAHNA